MICACITTILHSLSCISKILAYPKKVISLISRSFSKRFCIDHLHYDSFRMLHCMAYVARLSSAVILNCSSLHKLILGLDACWLSQYWLPNSIQSDSAFENGGVRLYPEQVDSHLALFPLSSLQ